MTDALRPVVIVGGGGHALVVAEALLPGAAVLGFYDDNPHAVLSRRLGLEHLGSLRLVSGDLAPWYVLGLGDLGLRRHLIERLRGASSVGVTHAGASVSASARLGRGVFVGPRAVVHTAAEVGDHAIINSGAIVEHECVIGENAHVAPGAVLGGNVRVGVDTLVGLGARVIPGVRIGDRCTIGAGAVVIRDVPDGAKVVGVPGRTLPASR
jgi:sugar O-acyltransferase (sialic acid O-acetyltransferase NeuD family)